MHATRIDSSAIVPHDELQGLLVNKKTPLPRTLR